MVSPPSRSRAEPATLPATAWAVLGMLSFEVEPTGYEIRKWSEHILRFFYWSPAMSQIYAELKRLEQAGYATSRPDVAADGRPRRVYAITPEGRDALAAWASGAPVGPPVLKHGPALRVWLGHLAGPETLRRVVTEQRERAERLAEEAERSRRDAVAGTGWAHAELVARWAVRYHRAERDLADRMLADLDELAARRPPG